MYLQIQGWEILYVKKFKKVLNILIIWWKHLEETSIYEVFSKIFFENTLVFPKPKDYEVKERLSKGIISLVQSVSFLFWNFDSHFKRIKTKGYGK